MLTEQREYPFQSVSENPPGIIYQKWTSNSNQVFPLYGFKIVASIKLTMPILD